MKAINDTPPRLTALIDTTFEDGPLRTELVVADFRDAEHDEAWQAKAAAQVSPTRREKAMAYSHRRGRTLSLGAALLLDTLLRRHGLRESQMTYVENEHGHPRFGHNEELLFSISHSGTMAAVALTTTTASHHDAVGMGLDIQAPVARRQHLFRHVLSADELQQMAHLDEEAQNRLFQRLWTHKEAYAKALTTGLRSPYPSPPPHAILHELDIGDYHLTICLLRPTT